MHFPQEVVTTIIILLLPSCVPAKGNQVQFPPVRASVDLQCCDAIPVLKQCFSLDAGVDFDRFVSRVTASGKDVAIPSPPRFEGDGAPKDWAATWGRTRVMENRAVALAVG